METLQRVQTIAPHCNGALRLAGLFSPYFQPATVRKADTARDIRIILGLMNLKAEITNYSITSNSIMIEVFLKADDGSLTVGTKVAVPYAYGDSDATIDAATVTAINTFCTSNSLPVPSIDWLVTTPTALAAAIAVLPAGLSNAPQAAIANAPADAVTNYNIVTTLLGSLTSAVNAANTKQNDIATKLNSLLAELRTLGLIAP